MVFDRDGNLILAGAGSGDQRQDDQTRRGSIPAASTGRGNVYVIERDAHRIVKLSPEARQVPAAARNDERKGNDATHLNLPSGIAILHNGNMVVTDGYGNNRVILFDKTASSSSRSAKGAGGPTDKGHRARRVEPAAQARGGRRRESLHHRPRGHRLEVFDKNLNYIREIRNDWNPWDVQHLAQGHRRHRLDRRSQGRARAEVQLKDGKILATWGKQGWGPASSTGCTASSSTRRARCTPPTPTVSDQKFVPGGATQAR
jgi:hypothetical protein